MTLAEFGDRGSPMAGATWIMRAPIRGEHDERFYVALGSLAELRRIEVTADTISIGAGATHVELAAALGDVLECTGLTRAATSAANPAIRHVATIGGNLCAWQFAASDLAPALLCLDAVADIETPSGSDQLPLDVFLQRRRSLAPATILTRIHFPRSSLRCAHARLPLRKAGDYPVAIVSIAAKFGQNDVVEDIRVAVGSVEAQARRWLALEEALRGQPADAEGAAKAAEAHAGYFQGRSSVEAPGWYRVQVLPTLVRRATQMLLARPA